MQPIDILAEMVNDMLGETASNLVCQHGVLYANDRADARAGEQCVLFVSKDVLRKSKVSRPNAVFTSV